MVSQPEQENRLTRIARIKWRIASGTYETPEKIESALDSFLDDYELGEIRPGEDRSPPPNRPK